MSPGVAECKVQDVRTAEIGLNGLKRARECLNDAMQQVVEVESPEQRSLVAHAIGTVLGMDMHDLLMPLLRQHPNLDRHGLLHRHCAIGEPLMTDGPDNLELQYLRRIDGKLDRLIEDIQDVKVGMTALAERFARVQRLDLAETLEGPR